MSNRMSTCTCNAPRCDAHGEHAPCSVCRDLAADHGLLLGSLLAGEHTPLGGPDEDALQQLQERGLVTKRRRCWAITEAGVEALHKRTPRGPLFVERHQ